MKDFQGIENKLIQADELRSTILQLDKQLQALEDDKKTLQNEIQTLLETQATQTEEMTNQIDSLQAVIDDLRAQLSKKMTPEKAKSLTDLQAKLQAKAERLSQKDKDLKALEKRVTSDQSKAQKQLHSANEQKEQTLALKAQIQSHRRFYKYIYFVFTGSQIVANPSFGFVMLILPVFIALYRIYVTSNR